jgi:predicted RNA methylase
MSIQVHRLMLQDQVRTNAYKEAIYNSSELFAGKIVMDVGAGTGIEIEIFII